MGYISSNLVDHGFYMCLPTFFMIPTQLNNWQFNNIYMDSMTPRQETEPFFYTEYEPGNRVAGSVKHGLKQLISKIVS
jgi:hypothetical protein